MSFGWAPGAFVTTTGTSTTQQFDWTTEAFHSDASDSQSSDLENIADPEQVEKPRVELRQYFPETWLFQLSEAGPAGQLDRSLEAPHTITSWEAGAVCISPISGLGVADPATLTTTQDFFADIRLPYAVKRGETFPLNITIFNYLAGQLPLQVTITEADLDLKQTSWSVCLEAGDSRVLTTPATARTLGNLNITVEAKIANVEGCATVEAGLGFKDALVKPLRVKAEGIPVEKVQSEFKCLNANNTGDSKVELERLELPDKMVEGSERAWLHVTGDIMAPALENVGNLVNMPTGCGEQNMVGLVPNIYLLQYLKSNAKEEPALERQAKEYMEIGYNKQQKYRHPDGAYSIWGPGDKDGSTWLTSFVVKSFAEAAEFISVNKEQVAESVAWLAAGQNTTGCFLKRGYVYSSSLQGGNTDDSLTAFVLTALLEASSRLKIEVDNKVIDSAVGCMLKSLNYSDVYSLSVAAYAAQLFRQKRAQGLQLNPLPDLDSQIDVMMDKLSAAANTSQPGARFWDQKKTEKAVGWWSYSQSKAVEMTAYNVLTLTLADRLQDAVDSVKWLARQRNSQGGFVSTQDTVVALQALSLYAQSVSKDPTDMTIQVSEQGDQAKTLEPLKLGEDNELLLQTQKVKSLPSKLELTMAGSGCALVQTVLRYNVPEAPSNRGFKLSVTPQPESLRICAAYTGPKEKTDMAVIEIEMVTGWEAYNPDYLLNEVDSGVKRVEEDKKENKVVLYFDDIPKKERCLDLEVKEVMKIENAKPARAAVYDYYNTEDRTEITYTMK